MSIEEFYDFKERLAAELSTLLSRKISDRDVMDALYLIHADNAEMDWIGDVWDLDISYEEARTELLEFDFNMLLNLVEVEEERIPPSFVTKKKARFKHKGTVWVIHRYDADPFPSLPHAHNMELNHKLDLSTGKCYEKKQFIYSFSKRDLLEIRERASKVSKEQLPPLAI